MIKSQMPTRGRTDLQRLSKPVLECVEADEGAARVIFLGFRGHCKRQASTASPSCIRIPEQLGTPVGWVVARPLGWAQASCLAGREGEPGCRPRECRYDECERSCV